MVLKDIINRNLGKYICVKNLVFDDKGLISSADIIKVYDTLDNAKHNTDEIKSMMSEYADFDIIYGSYYDYCSTRLKDTSRHDTIVVRKLLEDCSIMATQIPGSQILKELEEGKI